jgi:hypothetical protein
MPCRDTVFPVANQTRRIRNRSVRPGRASHWPREQTLTTHAPAYGQKKSGIRVIIKHEALAIIANRASIETMKHLRLSPIGLLSNAHFASLVTGMVLSLCRHTDATTIKAASASFSDVSAAVARAAHDGDAVIVPAGIAHWTNAIYITKGITIQGATTVSGPRSKQVANDATIILDDVARTSTDSAFFRASVAEGKTVRLTGFTFGPGKATTTADNGGVRLGGSCKANRVDHCHFQYGLHMNPNISTSGWIYGVVDHCIFDEDAVDAESFGIKHDGWGGNSNGDGSWADDSYFGTEKFLFIEDCTFNRGIRVVNGVVEAPRGGGLDGYTGGRYVARYNWFNNLGTQAHGTENTRRGRSARAIEVYNNTFNWTNNTPQAGELRGGAMVNHDNVYIGTNRIEHGISLACYREYYPFWMWGAANGANPLDSNDPHGVYASGTAGIGSGTNTLVVPGANWRPNQWVGYSVSNLLQTFTTGTGRGWHPASWIKSNTSHTIIVKSDAQIDGPNVTFATGDMFEIRKVRIALDQPGRGKGSLITADDPSASGVSWPNQALDPVYSWNNKRAADGSNVDLVSAEPTIQEGRDFFNNTAKPGYKPYVYPHPLVSGFAPPF